MAGFKLADWPEHIAREGGQLLITRSVMQLPGDSTTHTACSGFHPAAPSLQHVRAHDSDAQHLVARPRLTQHPIPKQPATYLHTLCRCGALCVSPQLRASWLLWRQPRSSRKLLMQLQGCPTSSAMPCALCCCRYDPALPAGGSAGIKGCRSLCLCTATLAKYAQPIPPLVTSESGMSRGVRACSACEGSHPQAHVKARCAACVA